MIPKHQATTDEYRIRIYYFHLLQGPEKLPMNKEYCNIFLTPTKQKGTCQGFYTKPRLFEIPSTPPSDFVSRSNYLGMERNTHTLISPLLCTVSDIKR